MTKSDNGVQTTYFVIADISGYTKFMAETAIEHAKGILESLFGDLVPAIRTPLKISGLQGDAVFAYAFESDVMTKQFILDFAEQLYCVFARSKEKMILNTGCPCDACSTIDALELKIVVHHGECIIQDTGGRQELAGQDVITAFRLLKNSVKQNTGLNAYSLITCDAIRAMDMGSFFDDSEFHSEDIEHIGNVEFVVRDLREAWQRRRNTERTFVEPTDTLLLEEWIIPLPVAPDVAFTICTRPDLRMEWLGANQVELFHDKKGKVEPGTLYHCYHGDDIFPFEIIDWYPGEYVTGKYNLPMGLSFLETNEIIEAGNGSLVKLRYTTPKSPKLMGKLMAGTVGKKVRGIIEPDKESRVNRMTDIAKRLAAETATAQAA
ncbi:DUF2652 domain-containing protein [Shimia abyssi]|uniref:Uncharacterized protein DUF2652 n=1 Tax=Shimia abyssi TaxID=1662395 RepID=A0A2P8FBP1_9RHOB|nr:DUF2652 domain-containing protein [Shimia abyssi]PSL19082.1 uncharacterized protein DUF2652 [Shimia abyssi]